MYFRANFLPLREEFGSLKENEVKRLRDLEKENLRLKRLLAERDVELDVVREFLQKKVSNALEKRMAVVFLASRKISQKRTCEIPRISRTFLR